MRQLRDAITWLHLLAASSGTTLHGLSRAGDRDGDA